MTPGRKNLLSTAVLLLGLGTALLLISLHGFGRVFDILLEGGWQLLWIPLAWLPSMPFAALSWQLLFPREQAPSWRRALIAAWTGRGVNTLLPVASLGGELVKARLATHWGVPIPTALASIVADKTNQALALLSWGLIGCLLLSLLTLEHQLAWLALGAFLLLGLGILGFILVQRAGIFQLLGKFADKLGKNWGVAGMWRHGGAVDQALSAMYKERRARFLRAALARLSHLVVQTLELWLACHLLGFPLGLPEAALLRSLSATASDALFIIPAGYGIQEVSLLALGALVGITPQQALALSLCLRLKEFCIDLPGVLYWQQWETRKLRRRPETKS